MKIFSVLMLLFIVSCGTPEQRAQAKRQNDYQDSVWRSQHHGHSIRRVENADDDDDYIQRSNAMDALFDNNLAYVIYFSWIRNILPDRKGV